MMLVLLSFALLALLLLPPSTMTVTAFAPFQQLASRQCRGSSSLSMVLEKPIDKKLAKIEQLKISSDHLLHPLKEVRESEIFWF
jgi:hypothetical protein